MAVPNGTPCGHATRLAAQERTVTSAERAAAFRAAALTFGGLASSFNIAALSASSSCQRVSSAITFSAAFRDASRMNPVTVSPRNAAAFSSSAAVETGNRGLILTEFSAAAGRPRCPFSGGLAVVDFIASNIHRRAGNSMFSGAKKTPHERSQLRSPASSQAFG